MFAGSYRRLPGLVAWFRPTRSSSTLGCAARTVNRTGFFYDISPSASTRNAWNHPTAFSHHAPGWLVRRLHMSSMFREEIRVVNAPAFAESVTEGDVRWEKAVGDAVKEDEVVCEIETDKTSIQVPAPAAGILAEFLIPDGGKVETGVALFKLQLSDAAVAQDAGGPVRKPARTPSQPPPSPPPPVADEIPSTMPPVPPIPTKPMHVSPVADIKVTPGASASVIASDLAVVGSRSEHRVRMSRMRQRTAQRLKEAQNTCALLTTFNELDMSSVMEMRSRYKDTFLKKHGIKLGFMSAFVHASCYALQHEPVVNAVIDDESKEIVYRDYVDISIAVATPKGLTVPVIRNVETMDYAGIEKAIHELGEKARKGELAIEDMDGGTFTISNGGVFGSLYGTPIVNPPQSAILGMHAIKERPVVINGKVEIRPMMYIALTYDHRLIDGREAVTFLCKIKEAVEDPRMILLNI
uniref:Dihydrolipoyllysine-residue succinyltransferase component of 2-oxoglutarate dehydrogenase complex, mitochondrial n=1 Tax=Eptatretus burgeri TaxID=7764 RepID=A0A8C4R090_EPTBU